MFKPAVLAGIVFLAFPVAAQESGDAKEGLKIAQDVCSECHAIQGTASPRQIPTHPIFIPLPTRLA